MPFLIEVKGKIKAKFEKKFMHSKINHFMYLRKKVIFEKLDVEIEGVNFYVNLVYDIGVQ